VDAAWLVGGSYIPLAVVGVLVDIGASNEHERPPIMPAEDNDHRNIPLLRILTRLWLRRNRRRWIMHGHDENGRRASLRVSFDENGVGIIPSRPGGVILAPLQAGRLRAAVRDALESIDQPVSAAHEIASKCRIDNIDLDRLKAQTERIGYPILGVVQQIVALCDKSLGEWCHWGATTQDITDTATIMQIRAALDGATVREGLRSRVFWILVNRVFTYLQGIRVAFCHK
jgi:hypothetical protein